VVGCKDIYSLGDCATIVPKTLASNIQAMFDEADVDRDGGVSLSEFKAWTEIKINEYPYKFLKSQLATKFSICTGCRADF